MTSTSTATARTPMALLAPSVGGGLAGGVGFGMLMQLMGMIPMVAALVGSTSVGVGWLVHLIISTGLGGLYGLTVAGRLPAGAVAAAAGGAGYGVIWWVLGALLLMPARLGMPVFGFGTVAWQSLMGHLVFGLVLGLVTWFAARRPARA